MNKQVFFVFVLLLGVVLASSEGNAVFNLLGVALMSVSAYQLNDQKGGAK